MKSTKKALLPGSSDLIGRVQRNLGKRASFVKFAVKLRNQCDEVIRYHLGEDWQLENNGELLLLDTVASHCRSFIDVGANVGEWANGVLLRSNKFEKGLLIDAGSHAISVLRSRFDAYRDRINIVHAAVSDHEGEADFYEEEAAGMTSSLVQSFAKHGAKPTKVTVVTLDEQAQRSRLNEIDLLKIDAEGFDLKVMEGSRLLLSAQKVGLIQFEYNRPWADSGSTLSYARKLLNSYGYELFLLKSNGLYEFPFEYFGEFFEYANFVAVIPAWKSLVTPIMRGKLV